MNDQVKIEKEKQQKVQKDKKACDHVGYYVGHGFELLPLADGSVIGVSALNCMMCGAIFYPRSTIIPAMPEPKNGVN